MTKAELRCPVSAVVIGASAGGVEALGYLLAGLPSGFIPALIAVQHLAPTFPSLLPRLFAQRCDLPVAEAEDKMPVEGGHVYIAPPDYHLLVERNSSDSQSVHFAMSIDPPVRFSRPSIDVLFESAAYAYGKRLLGIVLTGANDDGAQGLLAIRAAGGSTWVQEPSTAEASTMPYAAISIVAAATVLTLDQISACLARFC